jgi:hypothetical protein
MSNQAHCCKANAHDLRFWSRVQDELIHFCHDWCTGNEKSERHERLARNKPVASAFGRRYVS